MELTNDQWNRISEYIPDPPKNPLGGRPRHDNKSVMEGILWVLRSGARWKDLPPGFPSYQTCHRRFQQWQKDKVIENILSKLTEQLQKIGKIDISECFIDGTFSSAKKGATCR